MALAPTCRTIDLAKERDPSIDKMITSMENSKPGHKRIFQKLPKHLRRRAMSYDVKKVPPSMRGAVEAQTKDAMSNKLKNKPHGREPRQFRPRGYKQMQHRNEDHKWLETHLWHAKRFHIKDMWGWKIPFAPTMKGTRAIIRQTTETCTVRDISYNAVLSVQGNNELINTKLTQITNGRTYIEQNIHILFHLEISVGPIDVFRISQSHIWIIIHPLIKAEVLELFKEEGFTTKLMDGEINIFQYYGPQSTDIIRRTLLPSSNLTGSLLATLNNLPGPSSVPPGFSIAFVGSDPRSVSDDSSESAPDIAKEPPIDYLTDTPNPELCYSSLFEGTSPDFPTDEEFNRARAKLLFPKAEGPNGAVPVIMMQKPGAERGFGASWLLFVGFGAGAATWRRSIHCGARAIGLDASRLINLEMGNFGFPYDRPDTQAGLSFIRSELEELKQKNLDRPPAKRNVNLERELPQFLNSDDHFSLNPVKVISVGRGTPSRFAQLCLPIESDAEAVQSTGSREVIGYVTDGRNSLLTGSGRGLGFVALDRTSAIPSCENGIRLMMRELGSQFLHPVWIIPTNV